MVATNWPLVRIVGVHPGRSGGVRVVAVGAIWGNIQAPNLHGRSLQESIVIETIRFGRRYVGACVKKEWKER